MSPSLRPQTSGRAKPRFREMQACPPGQLVLDLPGVPRSSRDIRPGLFVVFADAPARGRMEVLDTSDHLAVVRSPNGRPVEVIRAKLRAV